MNSKRILAVFLVAIMGLSVVGMTAVATHAGPNINPLADADEWDGDDTDIVMDFNASDEANSTVTYETEGDEVSADQVEDIVLTIEYENQTHLELDMEDAEISNENTADEGLHATFTIDHDELDTLPGEINEDVVTNVSIAELDADGDEVEGTEMAFDVTFEFTNERSVAYVGTDSIDDSDVGMDVTTETEEAGWAASVLFGAEETTNYQLDEERTIDGSNTTVEYVLADEDMADRMSERSDGAEDGDLLPAMTVAHDGHVALVFLNEANEDIVDTETDTYAVYYAEEDRIHLYLGEEYDDQTAVNTHVSTHLATALDDFSAEDLADTYEGTGISFGELRSAGFSFGDAFTIYDDGFWSFDAFGVDLDVWDDDDENNFLPLFLVAGAGAAGKRRATEVAA